MTAVMLAISQKDLTDSLVQAMVQGEQQWLVSTLAAFMPGLWTLFLMLHLARPYMVGMVRKLTFAFCCRRLVAELRAGARRGDDDQVRAEFRLLPAGLRAQHRPSPDRSGRRRVLRALLVKLTGDVDDNPRHYRLSTFFMIAGALLWRVPQVLAIERTSQAFFAPVVSVLTSTNHPDLATWILVGSVVLVALTGAYIFNFVIGRAPRQTPQSSEPRSAEAAPGR